MRILEQLFNWMLVIGLVLMVGRILTAVLMFMDIPFITFFRDYSLVSVIILLIGIIGTQVMKDNKKKK